MPPAGDPALYESGSLSGAAGPPCVYLTVTYLYVLYVARCFVSTG